MSKPKFTMSPRMARAVALVIEQRPLDWDSLAHANMIRYLILECSNAAKAIVGEYKDKDGKVCKGLVIDGKPVTKCEVDLTLLREEFEKTAKLFECSNLKKTLAEGDYPQFKEDRKKMDYV